jgi:phosphoglycolate phosphatase
MIESNIQPPYAAVLFDLDGTLLDTLDDLCDSMNSALHGLGFPPHPKDAYRFMVGDGVDTLARRVLPPERRGDDEVWKALVAAMREEYGRRWDKKTRPYAGIPELLDDLAAMGVKMAVLSNKPNDFTLLNVGRFFKRNIFSAVSGAKPDVPKKPDPSAAIALANELGIVPERWLYLGDTSTDIQTALRAGMTPLGALWGFRPAEELAGAGAKALLERPSQLLEYLNGTGCATSPTDSRGR